MTGRLEADIEGPYDPGAATKIELRQIKVHDSIFVPPPSGR